VVLAWLLQRGIVVIPKSVTAERIAVRVAWKNTRAFSLSFVAIVCCNCLCVLPSNFDLSMRGLSMETQWHFTKTGSGQARTRKD
jgi:hypothetical protein